MAEATGLLGVGERVLLSELGDSEAVNVKGLLMMVLPFFSCPSLHRGAIFMPDSGWTGVMDCKFLRGGASLH